MERTDYEAHAKEVAARLGLIVKAAFKGNHCPPWDDPATCIHGACYRVTLKRTGPDRVFSQGEPGARSLSFDFWNSYNDMREGKRPTEYDILACVASDASSPTDPDEVAEEYGPMKPSQAIAAARFAARLQAFFSEEELTALGEIQ